MQGTRTRHEQSAAIVHIYLSSVCSDNSLDKLLRLRKDLATTLPCKGSQEKWLRLIVPMFHEKHLVKQSLVQLRPSGAIKRLNEALHGWKRDEYRQQHSLRSTKRHGTYLADDEFGLLVTDMTSGRSSFKFFESPAGKNI